MEGSSLVVILEGTTLLAILGIIAKEVYFYRRNKKIEKENGDNANWVKKKLENIGKKVDTVCTDNIVIKNEMKHFSDRCKDHLTTQSEINKELKEKLKCLDERVFEVATKEEKS